jgi:uncharacterized delta-60 repeat protein
MFMFTPTRIATIVIRLSAAIAAPAFAFVIFLSMVSVVSTPASAATDAEGDLDATFGNGGVVTTTIAGQIQKMEVMLDGDVLVYGTETVTQLVGAPYTRHKLARFNGDGALDAGFGTGGVLTLPVVISDALPDRNHTAVTLLTDGRFLVATLFRLPTSASTVARYTAAGTLDPAFGAQGIVTPTATLSNAPAGLVIYDMAVRPGGEIVLTGQIGPSAQLFVAQLSITHTLDSNFGTNGVTVGLSSLYFEFGRQIFIQSNGDVAVVGTHVVVPKASTNPVFYRFGPTGIQLTSGPGLATTCALNGTQVVPAPDGKFLATARGSSSGLSCDQTFFGRLNADFSLDPTFTVISGSVPIFNLVQADGRMIGSGGASLPSGQAMSALRYTPIGANDPTFGSGGIATAVITSTYPGISGTETITYSYGSAAATQLNGRITIGGLYVRDNTYQIYFALARFVGPAVTIRELRLPFVARQPQP